MPLPFSRITPLLLFLSALAWTATTALFDDTPGGWNIVTVTQNDSSLLTRALQNESNYSTDVKERVCVFEVHSAAQHVRAPEGGLDRRYNVQACPVTTIQSAGMCAKTVVTTDGSCGEYAIQLYEQTATDTLQVRAVTLIRTQANENTKASATPAPTAKVKSAAVDVSTSCSTVLALVSAFVAITW